MTQITELEKREISDQARLVMNEAGWTQAEFAEKCGLDQPFLSRILSGKFKRRSKRLSKFLNYVSMQLSGTDIPPQATQAVRNYFGSGGQVEPLCEVISLLTRVRTESIKRPGASRSRFARK